MVTGLVGFEKAVPRAIVSFVNSAFGTAGGLGSSLSSGGFEDGRPKRAKWKSTESAQERKTMAFITVPRRANARLRTAVKATNRNFAGTIAYACWSWAGAENIPLVSPFAFFSRSSSDGSALM